jgi:hypothetical protein
MHQTHNLLNIGHLNLECLLAVVDWFDRPAVVEEEEEGEGEEGRGGVKEEYPNCMLDSTTD